MARTTTLTALASIALLLVAAGAGADDGKYYSGAQCQKSGNNDIQYWWGRAYNNSSNSWSTTYCPIVKDNINASSTRRAWLTVIDRHYSSDASCTFASMSGDTNSISGYFSTRTSSGTDAGYPGAQSLVFPSVATYPWYQMFILCGLPPRYQGGATDIIGYRVDER